jgi:hypothetical protein
MKNKRLIGILAAAALLLLIPFLADAPWSLFDFVLAGVLLFGAGLVFEMILRTIKKFEHRIAISAVVLAALLLIWIELAVGLFGTRFAGN